MMGKRRQSLSKKLIVDTAYALADEVGPEKVTMHAIASKLYITSAGLYTYFESRDDIIELIYAQYFSEIDCRRIPGELWFDTLTRMSASYIQAVENHPLIALSVIHGDHRSKAEMLFAHQRNALFEEQGVDPRVIGRIAALDEALIMSYLANALKARKLTDIQEHERVSDWEHSAQEAYHAYRLQELSDDVLSLAKNYAGSESDQWRTPYQSDN